MEFLGNLGIDVKLLIAQMVNFGLLLWILAKFLYKPIVRRIEEDEKELKQAQMQKKELERQKDIFTKQKKKEIAEAKKRAKNIIKEAENIAEKIKKDTRDKANKEALAIIKQSRERLESLKLEIKEEILKDIRVKIGNSFRLSFTAALSLSSQQEFQNIFWTDFVKRVKELKLERLEESNLVEILKKSNLAMEKEGKKKNVLKKNLEEILAQKIGPMVLEYAHPLTAAQEKELEEIISKKSGIKLNITKKQNKNLINGFRFEIAGMVIENNLLSIINDAANFKK